MNYWPKHIGPWLKATVTLGAAEEGLYSRLCDWCYGQEQPLPLDADEIFRIARAHTKVDREVTMTMVRRFFVQTESGWRHQRIERELASVRNRASRAALERNKHAQHQRDYRDRRAVLFDQAQELGLPLLGGIKTTNDQLMTMIIEAGAKPRRASDHWSRTNGAASREASPDASRASITGAALETTNLPLREVRELREASRERPHEARAGAACKRIRALGMASVNPGDPRLLELLQLGVSEDDLAMAASEAIARSKGFAYALAIAKGRHEEQLRAAAEVAAWTGMTGLAPS